MPVQLLLVLRFLLRLSKVYGRHGSRLILSPPTSPCNIHSLDDICGLFGSYSCCHCSLPTTCCSLHKIVDLVGALKHLADLLHDRGVHTLSLLDLLAVAEDDSGGSLGDTEVLLM